MNVSKGIFLVAAGFVLGALTIVWMDRRRDHASSDAGALSDRIQERLTSLELRADLAPELSRN